MSEILGVLFAVLVSGIMLTTINAPQKNASDTARAIAVAQQQKRVYAAAAVYIEQNAGTIQATATATNPVVITVPMLQAAGMNLAGVSPTNAYGQTWQVQVLQPSPNNLQALVMSTGGDALPDRVAAMVAKYVGGSGGFIAKNDSGIYPGGAGTAYGSYAGWQLPTANYTGVSGGHPAALLTVVSGQVSNNYLYRSAVPGQPQLNQMNTALGMNGNDISNVGVITGKQANISRDGQAECCSPSGATLNLSEATWSTGRRPTLQFHAAGQAAGYMELDANGGAPRLNLINNNPGGLGINSTGTITAPNVVLQGGASLQVGNSHMYGDGSNSIIYQDGALYIRNHANTPVPIAEVQDVRSIGTFFASRDWWSMIAQDGSGNLNANPKDATGSIHVNDIYIRSIGKWASELATGNSMKYFTNVGASGVASADGIMVITGALNTTIIAYVDGAQRGYVDKRDKYGQGFESITIPIKAGESWWIVGAQTIGLMSW